MPILFWVCRDEEEVRWLVTVEDLAYGEYLSEELAILDAIDLAKRCSDRRRHSRGLASRDKRATVLNSFLNPSRTLAAREAHVWPRDWRGGGVGGGGGWGGQTPPLFF